MTAFLYHPMVCFAKLTDKSVIASLNHMQRDYLADGYRFYDYIENNILHTKKLNRFINTNYIISRKRDDGEEYLFSAERFEKLLKKRYGR